MKTLLDSQQLGLLLPRCPRDGFTSLRQGTQLHSGRERELERESTFDLWMYLSHALRIALPMIRHWLTALRMNLPLSDSELMFMLAKQWGRKEFLQMSGVIDQVLTHWILSPSCHLGTVVGQVTPCPGACLLFISVLTRCFDEGFILQLTNRFSHIMMVNDRKMN